MLTRSGGCFFRRIFAISSRKSPCLGVPGMQNVFPVLNFYIMKLKILFFAVLLPLLSFSQSFKYAPGEGIVIDSADTVFNSPSLSIGAGVNVGEWVPINGSFITGSTPTFFVKRQKCTCETLRDTTVHNEGNENCAHDWVLARHEDVNAPKYPAVTLAVYRPCPESQTTNFGRVCSKCLRHEIEHVTENWTVDHEKSKYRQLVEQLEKKQ